MRTFSHQRQILRRSAEFSALEIYAQYDFADTISNSLDDVGNWYIGGVPAVGLPTSADTATLDQQAGAAQVDSGTCAAPVTSALGCTITGGAFSSTFNVGANGPTSISGGVFTGAYSTSAATTITGGSFNGGFNASNQTLSSAGVSFAGSVTFGTGSVLNSPPSVSFSASGTTFNIGLAGGGFTDLGANTYVSGTWSGAVYSINGASTIAGADFLGVQSGSTFGDGITITSGILPLTLTLTNATVSGGTGYNAVTFTGTVNFTGATIATSATNGGITAIIAYTGGQNIAVPVAATAAQLISTVTLNGVTGMQHVAPANKVLSPTPTGTTTGSVLPGNFASRGTMTGGMAA
jgi:hypothetical protein